MRYAACFNSNTIGTIEEEKSDYYLVKFPGMSAFWVYVSSIIQIWDSEDDPQYDE